MAPSEHPETPPATNETPAPTGIQKLTEPDSIALPPLPAPPLMDESRFRRLCGQLDVLCVGMVLLFAFLVASFPAANPDFFRQLATGRLLAQGQYHFGVNPFVYSADDTYWVNHSWLFALLMYGLYQLPALGAAAVVIVKALVAFALAEVLLRASRRPGQSLWIPAVCTALAILVVSPRLYLQPSVLSFLFLALTLWFLTFVGTGGKRLWWLLPPLFALWVNCDSWFFLGPVTVALFFLGELLQQGIPTHANQMGAARPGELRTLGVVLALSVAACLLNPHHIHAFTLPVELGLTPAADLLESDPQFLTYYLSPVRNDYYLPYFGLSVAGLAYWPLLGLSLASFVLVLGRLPWPRLLIWLGFALLSLYNIRAIPFFAIVAGPILAWNWQDYTALRLAPRPLTIAWRNWALGGRALTVLVGLALLIATLPGWLQNQPRSRHLGWTVRVDPSLKAMAETIHAWRQDGRFQNLGEEPHWFNLYYEVADYLAWFAPGERVFLDPSLPQFRGAAEDYLAVRKGLEEMLREPSESEGAGNAPKSDWRQILRKRKVHYWIFDNLTIHKTELIVDGILFSYSQEKEWVLCYLQGRNAVFAWRDPQQPETDPSAKLKLDLKTLAFGDHAELAPPRGEEPSPPRSGWESYWEMFWPPSTPSSLDRETAGLYDFYYQVAEKPKQIATPSHAWQTAVAAGAIGSALTHGPVPNSLLALSWSCTYHDVFPPGTAQPTRPLRPGEQGAVLVRNLFINSQFIETPSLYLSVRTARRALQVSPDDGASYFRLGQAYQRLRELPQEQTLQALGSHLVDIRRVQMVAAFQNALRFPLDDARAAHAHESLFKVYMQMRYLDAATRHLREALSRRTAAGPPPGMSPTQFNERLNQISGDLSRLDNELQRLQNRYEVTAASKSGLEKVNAALDLGLPETALAVLEQSADTSVGSPTDLAIVHRASIVTLELGRLDRARDLLPDADGQSIKPDELDLHLRLAAARGDYEKADRLLGEALRGFWQPPPDTMAQMAPAARVSLLISRVLLGEGQRLLGTPSMPWIPNNPVDIFQRPRIVENPSDFWLRRWRLGALVNGLDVNQRQADLHLLRGWFALESGHCAAAREHFRTAQAISVPEERWVPEVNKLQAWFNAELEVGGIRQLSFRHAILHDLSMHYLKWLDEVQ